MAQKLVSFNKLDSILNAQRSESVVLNFETKSESVQITVKPYLSLQDMQSFVNAVISNSFDSEGGYHSEMFDIAVALQVMNYYTDLKIGVDGENNVTEVMEDRLCKIMYDSNVYENILNTIHQGQFQQIINAAREGIRYRVQVELSTMRRELDDTIRKLDIVTGYLENVNGVMNDASPDDMKAVLHNMANDNHIAMEGAALDVLKAGKGIRDDE